MKKVLVSVLITALSFVSCKNPTDSDVGKIIHTFVSGGVTYADGILETVLINNSTTGGTSPQYISQGVFYNSSGYCVQADTVRLQSNVVDWHSTQAYLSNSSLTYNTYHVWDIDGNSDVPTFKDSVLAPASFTITTPILLNLPDSISKGGGGSIAWTSPGTDSVTIVFVYEALMSRTIDNSITHTTYTNARVTVANTGTYTIPSGLLSSFPSKGVLMIAIYAYRDKTITVSTKQQVLRSAVVAQVETFIKS